MNRRSVIHVVLFTLKTMLARNLVSSTHEEALENICTYALGFVRALENSVHLQKIKTNQPLCIHKAAGKNKFSYSSTL